MKLSELGKLLGSVVIKKIKLQIKKLNNLCNRIYIIYNKIYAFNLQMLYSVGIEEI